MKKEIEARNPNYRERLEIVTDNYDYDPSIFIMNDPKKMTLWTLF